MTPPLADIVWISLLNLTFCPRVHRYVKLSPVTNYHFFLCSLTQRRRHELNPWRAAGQECAPFCAAGSCCLPSTITSAGAHKGRQMRRESENGTKLQPRQIPGPRSNLDGRQRSLPGTDCRLIAKIANNGILGKKSTPTASAGKRRQPIC